jgi:uronate dehydrogenase
MTSKENQAPPFERMLLTGAAGALGRVLRGGIKHLASGMRLSDREPIEQPQTDEEVVECDLGDRDAVLALTEGVDAVVHLGGISGENAFDAILNSNIVGMYNLYEGCRKNGVSRVVWASSNHAIGFYPRTQVIDATVPQRPDTNYGLSKAFGENVAQYYWDKYGIETVSMRIGSCFPKPRDRRMLSTWLSYPDLIQLVKRSLLAPRVEHTVIYGVSNNDMVLWDNTKALHIGYRPKDNAEQFRAEVEALGSAHDKDDLFVAVHGGSYASAGHFDDPS